MGESLYRDPCKLSFSYLKIVLLSTFGKRGLTFSSSGVNLPKLARVAELVDARVSKTRSLWECRFDPGPGHHLPDESATELLFFLLSGSRSFDPSRNAVEAVPWLMLDKRSLGILRISLGLILVADILNRFSYFKAHYTYLGVAPLARFLEHPAISRRPWSLFYISDSPVWVALLFLLYLLAAISLTAGYRVRLAGWICWLLAVSVDRRGPLLGDGGVQYMICLLMWGNFLPWGERFGLEAKPDQDSEYRSLAGFCFIAQVGIVYWFSAVLRVGKEWQVEDSALYYAMHIDPLTTALGRYLPVLGLHVLGFFTAATLFFEILGPILLFLPSTPVRLVSVLLIISFHLGIVATLKIPFFAFVCIAAALGLLPPAFWNWSWTSKLDSMLSGFFAKWALRLGEGVSPPAESGLQRKLENTIPVALLLIILIQLGAGTKESNPQTPVSGLARVLGLNQYWGMFSPYPLNFVGWESAVARTASGKSVTLLEKGERDSWSEARWAYFHVSLGKDRPREVELYLNYLVQEWQREHPEDPVIVAQYRYHPKFSQPDYLLRPAEDQVLGEYHIVESENGGMD